MTESASTRERLAKVSAVKTSFAPLTKSLPPPVNQSTKLLPGGRSEHVIPCWGHSRRILYEEQLILCICGSVTSGKECWSVVLNPLSANPYGFICEACWRTSGIAGVPLAQTGGTTGHCEFVR